MVKKVGWGNMRGSCLGSGQMILCRWCGSGVAVGGNHGHLDVKGLHAKMTWGRQARGVSVPFCHDERLRM